MATAAKTTAVTASTIETWLGRNFEDHVFERHALLWKMRRSKANVGYDGGHAFIAPVRLTASTNTGWIGRGGTVDTQIQSGFHGAAFDWAMLTGSVVVPMQDELMNSGRAQMVDVTEAYSAQCLDTMANDLTTALFATSTTNGIVGITGMCTGANYGGIAQATYSAWDVAVQEDTAESLKIYGGETSMEYCMLKAAKGSTNDRPDIIVTTFTLYQAYCAQVPAAERLPNRDLADAGFANVTFHGVPIVADANCPSTYMFFLNTNHLKLVSHTALRGNNGFKVGEPDEPANQRVKIYPVTWFGCLACNNRSAQAYLTGKTA